MGLKNGKLTTGAKISRSDEDVINLLEANQRTEAEIAAIVESEVIKVVADTTEMIALSVTGDMIAVVEGSDSIYRHNGGSAGTIADWTPIGKGVGEIVNEQITSATTGTFSTGQTGSPLIQSRFWDDSASLFETISAVSLDIDISTDGSSINYDTTGLTFDTNDYLELIAYYGTVASESSGGSGSYNNYETMDALTVDDTEWEVGGLTQATFGEETTDYLSGTKSYLFTNITGSQYEVLESPDVIVPLRSKAKENAITFSYTYNGDSDDIRAYMYDVTNSKELGTVNLEAASTAKEVSLTGYILSSTDTISLRLEILSVNNNAKLIFDDITFTDDPFVYKDLVNIGDQVDLTVTGTNWTTTRAVGQHYVTRDGAHRLRFNIKGSLSASSTNGNVTISGVTFYSGNNQAITATQLDSTTYYSIFSYVDNSSGDLYWRFSNAVGNLIFSGDIELASKPTWSDINSATTENLVTPMNGPKQYSEANGDFTITGTNWTTYNARAEYYMVDGVHKIKGAFQGYSSSSVASQALTLSGIDAITADQAIAVYASGASGSGKFNGSGGSLIVYANGSAQYYMASFDISLNSRPTWAKPVSSRYLAAVPKKVSVRYATSSGQNISNAAYTVVNFDTKVWDTHSAVTTGSDWKFIAPHDAKYRLSSQVTYASHTWSNGIEAYIISDRAPNWVYDFKYPITSKAIYLSIKNGVTFDLKKGEYIQYKTYQGDGSTVSLYTNVRSNYICIDEV